MEPILLFGVFEALIILLLIILKEDGLRLPAVIILPGLFIKYLSELPGNIQSHARIPIPALLFCLYPVSVASLADSVAVCEITDRPAFQVQTGVPAEPVTLCALHYTVHLRVLHQTPERKDSHSSVGII